MEFLGSSGTYEHLWTYSQKEVPVRVFYRFCRWHIDIDLVGYLFDTKNGESNSYEWLYQITRGKRKHTHKMKYDEMTYL